MHVRYSLRAALPLARVELYPGVPLASRGISNVTTNWQQQVEALFLGAAPRQAL